MRRLSILGLSALVLAASLAVPPRLALAAPGAWPTYHQDNMRSGNDANEPAFNSVTSLWTSAQLDGTIYAEPLVVGNTVYVATEGDSVYALDAGTGAQIWRAHLGTSVTSGLPCGNVNPLGITGTPVIDTINNILYVVAVTTPGVQDVMFALNTGTGAVMWSRNIDPVGVGFDPSVQSQRGALASANGMIYVPFGGRYGDCGAYNGWVVGVPASGTGNISASKLTGRGGGIWAPSGPAWDPSGNLYVATGNTFSASTFDYGESVIKLSPTLGVLDYFAPSNWASLNASDTDIGSIGPAILGASGWIFQTGKAGDGYLLNSANLGHIGGQAFSAHVCPGQTVDAVFGGTAYVAPYLYVPCTNGLVALTTNLAATPPTFSIKWQGQSGEAPIVAGGLVWTINRNGTLYGLDPVTGATRYTFSLGGATAHFATPSTGGGQIFVGAGTRVRAFGNAATGPVVTAVNPNSGPAAGGTAVTVTGARFTGATAVKFGSAAATGVTVVSDTQITATSPAGTGTVDVTVTTPAGTSATGSTDKFSYLAQPTVTAINPTSGATAGGMAVTITGTGLTGATAVAFGTVAATTFTVVSDTQITATSPAGTGTVDVTVTNPIGTSATSAADRFTYVPAPAITAVNPTSGPSAGGTSVTIGGSGFTGATAVKFGTVAAATFTVVSDTQVSATSPAGAGTVDITVTTPGGTSATSAADQFTFVITPGAYHSLAPVRILDTRDGTGGVPVAPLGTGGSLNVQITGKGGVPATAVMAVVLNATVTNTTTPSYLTVYPPGVSRPVASNLNWVAGQTVPNLVEVAVGSSGQVTVFNLAGNTDVIFDVAGYVSTSTGPDGLFNSLPPARILDTRNGTGGFTSPIGAGQTIDVQVAGQGNVPATGAAAVVLNLTVTNPTASSYLTAFPSGTARPLASNLNFVRGQTVPNRAIVKVGSNGKVSLFNLQGTVDVVADVGGSFTDASNPAATGSLFSRMTPTRILDTRGGIGPLGPGATLKRQVAGAGGVPASAKAVVMNVTVTNTTGSSFLTLWPDGAARPVASDLNWVSGQTVPNLVIVQLGANGMVDIYNLQGNTDVVMDVVGWYS